MTMYPVSALLTGKTHKKISFLVIHQIDQMNLMSMMIGKLESICYYDRIFLIDLIVNQFSVNDVISNVAPTVKVGMN